MRVEYNINRVDLALLNLYVLPRHRPNWILLIVVAAGFTVWQLSKHKPVSIGLLLAMGAAGIFVGVCAILSAFLFSLVISLARANTKSGQIGIRVLLIRPQNS